MKTLIVIMTVMLASCTQEATVSEAERKLTKVTDTRDGYVFYFWSDTMKDARANGVTGYAEATITTTKGIEMRINVDMEKYMRFETVKQGAIEH